MSDKLTKKERKFICKHMNEFTKKFKQLFVDAISEPGLDEQANKCIRMAWEACMARELFRVKIIIALAARDDIPSEYVLDKSEDINKIVESLGRELMPTINDTIDRQAGVYAEISKVVAEIEKARAQAQAKTADKH